MALIESMPLKLKRADNPAIEVLLLEAFLSKEVEFDVTFLQPEGQELWNRF